MNGKSCLIPILKHFTHRFTFTLNYFTDSNEELLMKLLNSALSLMKWIVSLKSGSRLSEFRVDNLLITQFVGGGGGGGGGGILFSCLSVCIASCLHSISWTNGRILTKLAQTHYWEAGKNLLDFGDLDLIFEVTSALWIIKFWPKTKKLVCTLPVSLEQKWRILAKLHLLVTLGWFKGLINLLQRL